MDRERRAYGQETRNFLTRLLPHDSFGTFLKVFMQYVHIKCLPPPKKKKNFIRILTICCNKCERNVNEVVV
jgi:hypothetical protein